MGSRFSRRKPAISGTVSMSKTRVGVIVGKAVRATHTGAAIAP
jgi:hypothetical protein